MANSREPFVVPVEDRKEFNALIQRANRRIKANQKYLDEHQIDTLRTRRSLMGQYEDIINWGTKSSPLSRSTKFDSKEHYDDFIDYIKQWSEGAKGKFDRSVEQVKEAYKQSIIEALNRTLINKNIPTENGEIPKHILDKLDQMSLDQLVHFFGEEADEAMENNAFDSDQVQEGDVESFERYVDSQIGWTQQAYPEKPKIAIEKPKKSTAPKSSAKNKKRSKGKKKGSKGKKQVKVKVKTTKAQANTKKTTYKKKL